MYQNYFQNKFSEKVTNDINIDNEYTLFQMNNVSYSPQKDLSNLSYSDSNSNLNSSESEIQLEPLLLTLDKRNHDIFFKSLNSKNEKKKIQSKLFKPNKCSSPFQKFNDLDLKSCFPNLNKQNQKFDDLDLKSCFPSLNKQKKIKTHIEGKYFS